MNTTLMGPWRLVYVASVALASFALASTGMVWVRTEVTSERYELARLIAERDTLREQLAALDVDVHRLSAAARIEPLARNLGLTYPEAGQVVAFRPRELAALRRVQR